MLPAWLDWLPYMPPHLRAAVAWNQFLLGDYTMVECWID